MNGRSSPRGMMFGFMAVLLGQLAVTAQATEVNVIYDKAYQSQTDVKAYFRAQAMGTIIQATIFAKDKPAVERIADRFSDTLTRHEDLLSVHKSGPMTNLNAHAGEWVVMPCEAAHVLQKAKDAAQLTNGAFDPTIGTVTAQWSVGFGGTSVPSSSTLADAKAKVDWRKVEVDFSNESQSVCRARIGQGQSVDLGGIGKGWSNQILAKQVEDDGAHRAMVVLGGNTAFVGKPTYGDKWLSAIPSAEDQYDYVGYFKLKAGDIVTTSSDKERHIDIKGKRYGHIMSGRTGKPAENTFAYVTVIDHDGARGDALSTALWVMGDKAFDFLKAHPDIQALLVMKNENAAYVTQTARMLKATGSRSRPLSEGACAHQGKVETDFGENHAKDEFEQEGAPKNSKASAGEKNLQARSLGQGDCERFCLWGVEWKCSRCPHSCFSSNRNWWSFF